MASKPKPWYASSRALALIGLAICAELIAIYGWSRHRRAERATWPQVQVSVSQLRTRLTRVGESARGTSILYQTEAQVRYGVEGRLYDRWFPILSPTTSRQFLQIELSDLNKQDCSVHWEQSHPDHAFLTSNWSTIPPSVSTD